ERVRGARAGAPGGRAGGGGVLPDGAAPEDLLQLTPADRHVGAGPDPGAHLRAHPAVLEFADDSWQAAVLLNQLERRLHERALALLLSSAAHQATEQTIEQSHGSPPLANTPKMDRLVGNKVGN